ncbi:MAG: hypothetical protein VX815_15985, partial [Gemmatimonadota bacterium]|nr:hypothetical protein [Gemmatimonadota bacterium]
MSLRNDGNGEGSVLRRLSGDPGGSLGARVAHHGARILLVVVLAGLVTFFFLPEGQAPSPYEDWIVAPDDVIAEFAFDVPKTAAELEAERNSVRDAVPPTFDFVTQNADTTRAELEAFFDQLDSAAVDGDRDRLQGILVSASASQVEFIVDDSARAAFRNSAVSATRDILALGVVEATRMAQVTTDRVTIRETEERSISKLSEDMLTSRDFYDQARLTYDAAALPALADPQAASLFRNILIGHMRPTYVFNLLITQQDEDA